MTLGEMRALLAAEGIRLTRSLGQNFLHDGNQLRRIVTLAEVTPDDAILEIGPGLGPLTAQLLDTGARVVAVEKDARLVPLLQRTLGANPRFQLVQADALQWLESQPSFPGPWKLVSNLPYSVGSRLLVDLANLTCPPATMTVTLQAEVVDRIRARPGTEPYGLLTALLQRTYLPGPSFRIPASCFFPAPDVASACIRLERRPEPLATGTAATTYDAILKLAFTQRRKQLAKVLRAAWPAESVDAAFAALQLAPDTRAETLSPAVFAQLARLLG